MQEAEQLGLDQIRAFLEASQGIRFEGKTREQIYTWVEKVLVHHDYQQQGRGARGLLRRYLEKMTGLSRAQVTRLIERYRQGGKEWHRGSLTQQAADPADQKPSPTQQR